MKKEVVWVLGPSAVGKETFIRRVSSGDLIVPERYWLDKKITFSQLSVNNIGHFENDPVIKNREGIEDEVVNLLEDYDAVFIKWQFVDSDADRLNSLRKRLPSASHKIVVLTASYKELSIRLPKKVWWKEGESTDVFIKEEMELIIKELDRYHDNFEILELNG